MGGANVAILYHGSTTADEAAQTLASKYNVKASAHKVNVTHSEEVEVAVDKVVSDFNGRLDVFIANSGIACMYPISLSLSFSLARKVILARNVSQYTRCSASLPIAHEISFVPRE